MSDDQKDLPPKPPVPVARGFSCGGGPCRTFYVFENEAQQEPIKTLDESEPAEPARLTGAKKPGP
jgi:hypothetical protein